MHSLPKELSAFADFNQFILWTTEVKNGKLVKIPISCVTGTMASVSDPNTWCDIETALNSIKLFGENYGIGFVFTKDDPFFFVDIDKCRADENSPWSDTANTVCDYFKGAAIEVSQSGRGLHIFGKANHTPHACKNIELGIEFYTESRFVALTGREITGDANTTHDQYVPAFVANFVPEKVLTSPEAWTTSPVVEWCGLTDDDELIKKALKSSSAASVFGGKASFADLWNCNIDALSIAWPPCDGDKGEYDESSADMALFQHLAFWTGKDCERILRLAELSGLVRGKWASHKNYLRISITRAVSLQEQVHSTKPVNVDKSLPMEFDAPKLKGSPNQKVHGENIRAQKLIDCAGDVELIEKLTRQKGVTSNAGFWLDNSAKTPLEIVAGITATKETVNPMDYSLEPKRVTGLQYLGYDQQIELFDKCVYVQDIHKVFTPSGAFLKPDQFNATYGGYSFSLDELGDKETRKAWEAFTESQLVRYPKAETTCFKPLLTPGAIVINNGTPCVNVYVPIKTDSIQGDITPFLNHLKKVLPVKKDQKILLNYMAAIIQHKGIKFQWAPLLQGVQGNGKTLFTSCIAFAIGQRYTHKPRAEQITEKYNEFLYKTLFVGIEDIYVSDHKIDMIEILKPMITDDRQEIRGMREAGIMRDVCCNFMFNSNHRDAIRLTKSDRRYAVFYSAQQTLEDLKRDGMVGSYFYDLYKWLKTENGFQIVNNYLENYKIKDELNPATNCHRAPETSSTNDALQESLGGVEQEINQCIEECQPGFSGGWISSIALNTLLIELHANRKIPPNKRKHMLNNMGYIQHPALKNGRVNNYISTDQGKPRLYIKSNHISINLTTCSEVVIAYENAQNGKVINQSISQAARTFGK